MNNTTFILLTLLVICWTLNPFLKKMMGSRLPANENMIFNHSLCTIIIVVYTIYLLINHKCDMSKIQSLSKKDVMLGIVTSVITVALPPLLLSSTVSVISAKRTPFDVDWSVLSCNTHAVLPAFLW